MAKLYFKGFTALAKPVENTFDEFSEFNDKSWKSEKKIQLLRGFSVLFTVFLLGKQEKVYHNTWQNYEDSVNIASIAIL